MDIIYVRSQPRPCQCWLLVLHVAPAQPAATGTHQPHPVAYHACGDCVRVDALIPCFMLLILAPSLWTPLLTVCVRDALIPCF